MFIIFHFQEPNETDTKCDTHFFNSSFQADSEELTGLPVMRNIDTWLIHRFSPDILLHIEL